MSGHSKFANIKHKKEKNDAAKGKIFTIIGKEIVVAVKEGGANPENNSKLRDVIAKAKANNMPNDTIKTFSRGGSDVTGSIVAKAVKADLYENWTDVSGVLVTDPRIIDNPGYAILQIKLDKLYVMAICSDIRDKEFTMEEVEI